MAADQLDVLSRLSEEIWGRLVDVNTQANTWRDREDGKDGKNENVLEL